MSCNGIRPYLVVWHCKVANVSEEVWIHVAPVSYASREATMAMALFKTSLLMSDGQSVRDIEGSSLMRWRLAFDRWATQRMVVRLSDTAGQKP